MDLLRKKALLVGAVCGLDTVKAIGQTGDIRETPQPGKGDIDLFVLCDTIPAEAARRAAYETYASAFSECRMTVDEGGNWGTEDALVVDGVDVFFMYFEIEEMRCYIGSVLKGRHPDREGAFYPTGRLAAIQKMNVLYDEDGTFAVLKDMVREYPDALCEALFRHHFERIIDAEDFERAVSRKDVLFYHMVLEESIDRFLQALFALNKVYFPSRKRSQQYLDTFARIPHDCHTRMLRVIEAGSHAEGIARSFALWRKLADELGRV